MAEEAERLARQMIVEGEGLELKVYEDSVHQYKTVGYGHKLLPNEMHLK